MVFHVKRHTISYQDVSRETFRHVDQLIEEHYSSLYEYLEQLLWWNQRINLVSRDVSRETIWEHIRHSLLITGLKSYQESTFIVDAGTGGGLPGMPLAIVSKEKRFLLNDIVSKKILALKQMVRKLSLKNVSVLDCPIKKFNANEPFLLISKHAFKIDDLYRMVKDKPWTSLIFYKGSNFEIELQEIDDPLSITSYDLYQESNHSFYKDKAIIEASRDNPLHT